MATQSQKASVVTVILVHGAWADGSSWNEVIARLQAEGLAVVSVQNPLSSLADDVAAVQRAMEMVEGPIVLVGHSWGGTVITQAGASARVRALVYIAAFAPDRNQSTNALQAPYPVPEYAALLRADSAGYLHFPADALPHYFAQDLPAANAKVLAATQGPDPRQRIRRRSDRGRLARPSLVVPGHRPGPDDCAAVAARDGAADPGTRQ